MALIQCMDCGKDVSTLASSCPNCGRPVDEQQSPLLGEKRIACPDGNCTGILGADEKCRTCGKSADWRDDDEEISVSSAIDPEVSDREKPRPKGGLLVVSIILIAFLLIILHFAVDKGIEHSKASDENTQNNVESSATEASKRSDGHDTLKNTESLSVASQSHSGQMTPDSFGCLHKDDMDQAVTYVAQGDKAAFGLFVNAALDSGHCAKLNGAVIVTDYAIGLKKVRPSGGLVEYWTLSEWVK